MTIKDVDIAEQCSYIRSINTADGARQMAIMMYIFDNGGKELAKGVFGGNGSSPKIDGQFDHSRRLHCHFCGGANLTAADFGLDKIRVKVWGPGEGPGKRSVDWFTVEAA